MKCLDCWREVDKNERGKGKKLRCDECKIIHRKAYNKVCRRKYYESKRPHVNTKQIEEILYLLKNQDCSVGMLAAFCGVNTKHIRTLILYLRKKGYKINMIKCSYRIPYVEKFYTLKA